MAATTLKNPPITRDNKNVPRSSTPSRDEKRRDSLISNNHARVAQSVQGRQEVDHRSRGPQAKREGTKRRDELVNWVKLVFTHNPHKRLRLQEKIQRIQTVRNFRHEEKIRTKAGIYPSQQREQQNEKLCRTEKSQIIDPQTAALWQKMKELQASLEQYLIALDGYKGEMEQPGLTHRHRIALQARIDELNEKILECARNMQELYQHASEKIYVHERVYSELILDLEYFTERWKQPNITLDGKKNLKQQISDIEQEVFACKNKLAEALKLRHSFGTYLEKIGINPCPQNKYKNEYSEQFLKNQEIDLKHSCHTWEQTVAGHLQIIRGQEEQHRSPEEIERRKIELDSAERMLHYFTERTVDIAVWQLKLTEEEQRNQVKNSLNYYKTSYETRLERQQQDPEAVNPLVLEKYQQEYLYYQDLRSKMDAKAGIVQGVQPSAPVLRLAPEELAEKRIKVEDQYFLALFKMQYLTERLAQKGLVPSEEENLEQQKVLLQNEIQGCLFRLRQMDEQGNLLKEARMPIKPSTKFLERNLQTWKNELQMLEAEKREYFNELDYLDGDLRNQVLMDIAYCEKRIHYATKKMKHRTGDLTMLQLALQSPQKKSKVNSGVRREPETRSDATILKRTPAQIAEKQEYQSLIENIKQLEMANYYDRVNLDSYKEARTKDIDNSKRMWIERECLKLENHIRGRQDKLDQMKEQAVVLKENLQEQKIIVPDYGIQFLEDKLEELQDEQKYWIKKRAECTVELNRLELLNNPTNHQQRANCEVEIARYNNLIHGYSLECIDEIETALQRIQDENATPFVPTTVMQQVVPDQVSSIITNPTVQKNTHLRPSEGVDRPILRRNNSFLLAVSHDNQLPLQKRIEALRKVDFYTQKIHDLQELLRQSKDFYESKIPELRKVASWTERLKQRGENFSAKDQKKQKELWDHVRGCEATIQEIEREIEKNQKLVDKYKKEAAETLPEIY